MLDKENKKYINNNPANKNVILFIIIFMTPLSGMGVDILVPSLPFIAKSLNASYFLTELTVSFYILGYGVSQIFYGVWSDVIGRKKLILYATVLYSITTIIIPISDIDTLIFLRFLQGVFVAASTALARAIVTDSYSENERKKIANYLVIAWGIGPIIAPAIGGYLQENFNWHASFYFLFIYSASIIILVHFSLPETNLNKSNSIINSFKNITTILKDYRFLSSSICAGMCLSTLYVFNIFSSFIIIDQMNYTPIEFGNILLFVGSSWLLGSLFNRFILQKININKTIYTSLFIAFICVMLTYFFSILMESNIYLLASIFFIIIFCLNIVFTRCFGICLSLFPTMAGTAGALTGTVFIVFGGICTLLASFIEVKFIRDIAIIFFFILSAITLIKLITDQHTSRGTNHEANYK